MHYFTCCSFKDFYILFFWWFVHFFLNLEAWRSSSSNVGGTNLHFVYFIASNRQRLRLDILAFFLHMGKRKHRDIKWFTKEAYRDECPLGFSDFFKIATIRLCWFCLANLRSMEFSDALISSIYISLGMTHRKKDDTKLNLHLRCLWNRCDTCPPS